MKNVVIPASSTQLRHVLLNKLRKMLEEAHERERKKSVREKKVKFNYFYHKSYVIIFFSFYSLIFTEIISIVHT